VLVDSFDHPKPPGTTEGTFLGPFHTHETNYIDHGASVSGEQNGEPLLVVCYVNETQGRAVVNVKIDIWETDSTGHYVQYSEYTRPDRRRVIHSDNYGLFWFKAITPVPYPISTMDQSVSYYRN
jgi:protocatechuate 3,4-dioxygenase beta subunit